MTAVTDTPLGVEQLREAYRWARARTAVASVLGGGDVVTVLAAHGGAGASTLALALAESLAATRPTRLVDVAEPVRSGLTCASTTELGPDGTGWLLGRRGDLQVDRRDPGSEPAGVVPPPRAPEPGQVVVIDQGTQDLGSWEAAARSGGGLVVAALATAPSVQAALRLLEDHPDAVLVLVDGPHRTGRRLRTPGQSVAPDRVVRVPYLRRLLASGLTADPLDRRLLAAGERVRQLLRPRPAAVGGGDLIGDSLIRELEGEER